MSNDTVKKAVHQSLSAAVLFCSIRCNEITLFYTITLLTAPLFCDGVIYSKNMSMNKHYSGELLCKNNYVNELAH